MHNHTDMELNVVVNKDGKSEVDPRRSRGDSLSTKFDTEVEEGDASAKWDYVIMFQNVNPPKDKEGNSPPATSKSMEKFRDTQAQRKAIVKQLQNPEVGLHVARKRSSDGNSVFVLITASMARLEDMAEQVGLNLRLKLEHGGAYAPFEVKHRELYELASAEEGLFRKTHRGYLIQAIIEYETELGGAGLNLDALVRDGVVSRVYPLHSETKRKDLVSNWAALPRNMFKWQPISQIRDYYGEEITIYFAWLGFYTQWLWYATAVGLLTTFFWAVTYWHDGEEKAKWTLWSVSIYCVFLALWSTCFLEYWKRYNNELTYEWGMRGYQDQERERPDYHGEPLLGVYSQGIWIPLDPAAKYGFKLPPPTRYYPSTSRRAKIASQVPLVGFMVCLVVVLTVSVLSFRLFVQNVNSTLGSVIGGIANAITIMFMNVMWKTVAVKLNNWENHRTDSEYENSLIMKIFAFYFVNSYTSLFYIAFFKGSGRIFNASALKDACKSGRTDISVISSGCMDELTIQLVTILCVNLVVGQSREVAIPWLLGKVNLLLLKRNLKKNSTEPKKIAQWEKEAKKPAFPGTFDEYSEMVIQFGYITLFAASFPLAPLLAVLNNMVEIRTDALKLLEAHSRPEYRGATGIGAWYTILELLGFASVITNCLLIGFSLNSVADVFGGVPDIPSAKRISQTPFYTFAVIVILEHILFGAKYFLSFAIPDMPGWIAKDIAKQEWIKSQTLKSIDKHEKKVWEDTIKDDEADKIEDAEAKEMEIA